MRKYKFYQLKEGANGYSFLKPNKTYREDFKDSDPHMKLTVKRLVEVFPEDWIETQKFTYGK